MMQCRWRLENLPKAIKEVAGNSFLFTLKYIDPKAVKGQNVLDAAADKVNATAWTELNAIH
jgi:hypothetical protein